MTPPFLSNLGGDTITSSLHANCFPLWRAVQFAGSKSWFFMDPRDFMGPFGVHPSLFMLPQRAPSRPFRLYRSKSRPGDVLLFPPNGGPPVKTHGGPQLMMNSPIFSLGFPLGPPWNFGRAMFTLIFLNWKMGARTPPMGGPFQNAGDQEGGGPPSFQTMTPWKLAAFCFFLGRPPLPDGQFLELLRALC
eukprot:UN1837